MEDNADNSNSELKKGEKATEESEKIDYVTRDLSHAIWIKRSQQVLLIDQSILVLFLYQSTRALEDRLSAPRLYLATDTHDGRQEHAGSSTKNGRISGRKKRGQVRFPHILWSRLPVC